MGILILIRHGQSQWNLENRFAGWSDVPLTDRGREDAVRAAKALSAYHFNRAFTSKLVRASETLEIMLQALHQSQIPIEADVALNERHYGDLQGLNKAETAEKFGKDQVQQWRRSFFTQPPGGESMEDCEKRTLPYFLKKILPYVVQGETVLVVAHGNSLRPMIKYLDHLEPEATALLEIGLCIPYVYTFERETQVTKEILPVEGIVTKGASLTEKKVKEGKI